MRRVFSKSVTNLPIAAKFPQYVGSSENHVPGGWSKLQNQREKINLKINGV